MAQTLQQMKKATLKTWFNEVCPPPLIESYNKSENEIKLVNGFTIYIVPSDDDEKLRSMNVGICHIEEASGIKESIYVQVLSRLRDPFVKNRTVFVCSNPEQSWIKTVLVDNERRKNPEHPEHEDYNPFIHVFIWETKLNKHLPEDFIELNSKNKPSWWIRKYLEGSFEAAEGAVYPNFATTVIEPYEKTKDTDKYGIPNSWERVIGADFGLRNSTVFLFGAIDPKKGEIVLYKEYYVAGKTVPEHAIAIRPLLEEIPIGRLRFIKGDPSGRNRNPINGKSIIGLFQEYGIFISEGNNNVEAGLLRVSSYIERGRLKIYNTCVNTIKEGLNYKYKELDIDSSHENLDERPIKANDHAMDSLKYMMLDLYDDPDLLKSESHNPPNSYSAYKIYDTIEYDEDMEKELDYLSYY